MGAACLFQKTGWTVPFRSSVLLLGGVWGGTLETCQQDLDEGHLFALSFFVSFGRLSYQSSLPRGELGISAQPRKIRTG